MDDAYKIFFSADITKLPTDVLKSIGHVLRRELDIRRRDNHVAGCEERDFLNDSARTFKGLYKPHFEYSPRLHGYLDELLKQDWSYLFPGGDEDGRYYVYIHYQPNGRLTKFISPEIKLRIKGTPFYVGKGTGNRAFDLNRNQGHGEILRSIIKAGAKPDEVVAIVKDNLTESEALQLESKLIYFFGTRYERGRRGLLVNLDIPPRPNMEEGRR